ncbi:MAG: DUF2971 domain-containing protein, partial [Chromatiales bacterium]|nr:DUF2971 domain-containing protein [Chromatiales bacterium]
MSKSFYRFRSATNLLDGYNELEKQTIYFAPPEQLNDPMEGYRDIFWRGDLIARENLFSHYLFCLERLTCLLHISGEDHRMTANDIPVFGSTEDLPTETYKQLFRKIKERFLKHSDISVFIGSISSRSTPVRREELNFYLDCIHLPAIKIIFDVYIEENLSQESNRLDEDCYALVHDIVTNDFIGILEKSIAIGESEESIVTKIFTAKKHLKEQTYLINKHNGDISQSKPNRNLVMNEFSSSYLERLKEITFPKWYTSCFMSECENSSVWGHYGDNHTGMCLIFDSDLIEDKRYIKLNGITGWGSSGPSYGKNVMELHSIDYEEGFGEIDFFTSIGSLPIPVLNKMWYVDENKNLNSCAHEMNADENAWRSNYWSNFIRDIKIKSKDWEYENEYRLILNSSITDLSEKDRRTLTYDFSSLKGIIFGINSKEEDKLQVMKIIEEKCLNSSRDDFKFYQAYYSSDDNC